MEVCSECNVLFKCIKLFHVWFIVQAMWCSVYVTCGLPNVGGGFPYSVRFAVLMAVNVKIVAFKM